MERTEEFLKVSQLFLTEEAKDHQLIVDSNHQKQNKIPNKYSVLAKRVAVNIDSNDALLLRLDKLSGRKEFSNDPTDEMTELSELFHLRVTKIQSDTQLLKQMIDDSSSGKVQ